MTSPIQQVSPTSLEAIFNKNPLELTDAEIDIIVEAERKARLSWKPEEKKRSKVDAAPDLKLEDIGL
jgi:hypothetical protein